MPLGLKSVDTLRQYDQADLIDNNNLGDNYNIDVRCDGLQSC